MATADYLLKIEGISGESKQAGFEDCMDIQSWSWGAMNSGSWATGGGGGTGKVTTQDFHFVIHNGKSTTVLFQHCASGEHFPKAELICRKAGGGGTTYKYYIVTFDHIVISSYQEGGSSGSEVLPMAQVSFNYKKVTVDYSEQKPDGSVQSTGPHSYDNSTGENT